MRRRSVTILDLSDIAGALNTEATDQEGERRNFDQKAFEGERESMFGFTRPKRSKTVYSPPVARKTKIEQIKWRSSGRVAVTLAPEEVEMWQENEMGIVIKAISSAISNKDSGEKVRIKILKKNLLDLEKVENIEDELRNIEENCYIPTNTHDDNIETEINLSKLNLDKQQLRIPGEIGIGRSSGGSPISPGMSADYVFGGSKSTTVSDDLEEQKDEGIKFSPNEKIKIRAILSQNTKSYDVQMSILLIGDSRTGKTSLMNQFVNKEFVHNTPKSSGMDYKIKDLEDKGQKIRFKVWDTNSEKKKENVLKTYYSLSDAIIIMYDVTNRDTFEGAKFWYQSISDELEVDNKAVSQSTNKKSPIIVLLGNKIDLKRERIVTKEMSRAMNEMHPNIHVIELSVQTMKEFDELFLSLGQLILKREEGDVKLEWISQNMEEGTENIIEEGRSLNSNKLDLRRKGKDKQGHHVQSQACKCIIF